MIGFAVSSCEALWANRDISAAFRDGGIDAAILDEQTQNRNYFSACSRGIKSVERLNEERKSPVKLESCLRRYVRVEFLRSFSPALPLLETLLHLVTKLYRVHRRH